MATVSWGTPETAHIALSVAAALANGSNLIAVGALNPSGYIYSSWEFNTSFHVAPSNGGSVDLYLVPAVDGTNYGAGGDGVTPPTTCYVGSFPTISHANSGMRLPILNLPMSPLLVKPLIKNSTGQSIPASSGILTVRLYNEVVA